MNCRELKAGGHRRAISLTEGASKRKALRRALTVFAGLSMSACGSLVPGESSSGDRGPAASDRSYGDGSGSDRIRSSPRSTASRPADAACLAELGRAGTRFDPQPDSYDALGCAKLGPVRLSAVRGDLSRFAISNIGPVECNLARTFGAWARFGVDRAARQILGSGLSRIETMGSYSCRNIAGSTKRSAHSRAAAVDVSAFILEDGRRISLQDDWQDGTAEEREFLRTVHRSACKRFGTVLGPDYNRAHRDHFHLEESGQNLCR